jgi:endonuclease-3
MQMMLDLGPAGDFHWMRHLLRPAVGKQELLPRIQPIGQLVRSTIGGRTYDRVSWAAYERLVRIYPGWRALAEAKVPDVESVIADVRFPDRKAALLNTALQMIARRRPDFDLRFLGRWPVARALSWLERLPGVGRKVAASTLNFSTLAMPSFVVDTDVLRFLVRFGTVRASADATVAYAVVMGALPAWSATDLLELHVLLKHLGQEWCSLSRPRCDVCPLATRCRRIGV